MRARKALTSLPWVRQAQVDYERQQAVVTVISQRYDAKLLLRVLEKEDFKGRIIEKKDKEKKK